MTRVKICGVRTISEATLLVQAGADALGILVGPHAESQKHFVTAAHAQALLKTIPPFVAGVVVTTYDDIASISALIQKTSATTVQIHSALPFEDFAILRSAFPQIKLIAVIHVRDDSSKKTAETAAKYADALVLDSARGNLGGGTGVVHDWKLSAQIVRSSSVPIILAGGLNPQNIRDAIGVVHPFAIDTRSGVCTATGEKDMDMARSFINQAHTV